LCFKNAKIRLFYDFDSDCFIGTCKVPVTWAVLGQVLVEKMFEIGENSCMGGAAIAA
jgi:hypothetical protein